MASIEPDYVPVGYFCRKGGACLEVAEASVRVIPSVAVYGCTCAGKPITWGDTSWSRRYRR